MRKFLFPLFALALFVINAASVTAQKKYEVYSVGFYNLENLFDTIHDAGKNDFEFLPDGTNKWGTMKYTNKLKNMATVLNEMSTDMLPMGLAAVGVSEIENYRVLDDLVSHPVLAHRGWKIVHIEGPDRRGVDCALLYNPKLFSPVASKLVPYTTEDNDTTYKTRGFLTVSGDMAGERVHIIVNHWPSRYASSPARERAAVLVKAVKDSLMAQNPQSKVIIMGDMNDDPDDKSMKNCLGAKREQNQLKHDTDLYNPWWNVLRKKGLGTLKYKGKWNLFDQIVFSGNLVGKERSTLKFYKPEIFSRSYMLQTEGKYKGSPKRTHAGGVWLNGYSDHLPVIIYLIKEQK
ncbi:MAG: endonuclease/exonuclease/phosphatase family protein [Bacteroidaceae bacterium]|nr:endonuclease/exonuclease/phosphatase family protein [Bacteroidaceae bacterium]